MKNKNSGVTASGSARPEFMNGDICRDKYGDMVTIKGMAERCVTYRRGGYEYDCVIPVYQSRRSFSLAQAAPRSKPTSRKKARANIRKIKRMLNVFRDKK